MILSLALRSTGGMISKELTSYLNCSPGFYWITDSNNQCTFVNKALSDYVGEPPERLLGTGWLSFFHEDDRDGLHKVFIDATKQRDPFRCEARIRHHSGSYYWLLDLGQPLYDGSGEYIGYTGVCLDIHELHQSNQRLSNIFEYAPIGLCLTTPEGKWTKVNPAMCKLLGYSPEEFYATDFQALTYEEDLARDLKLKEQMISGEQDTFRMEKRYLHKSGKPVWTQLDASVIRTTDGKPTQLVGHIQDIRDRIEAEKQQAELSARLYQAQKMEALGTLSSGIAHDFNNMLGAIIGYIELVRIEFETGGSKQEINRLSAAALDACDRARQLIQRMMTFSQPSERSAQIIDTAKVVKEACSLLQAGLTKAVKLELNIKDSLPSQLTMDPILLHQIILNLGSNACQAMESTGLITISVEGVHFDLPRNTHTKTLDPGSYVKLTFSDSGIGITSEDLPRVFDPFFTTKGPGEGTGLGLSVVHGIIKSLDGGITIHSQAGEGATFEIFLPMKGESRKVGESLRTLGNEI